MTDIGFIGLGTMGRPMAERLLAAGHKLNLFRVKQPSQYLVEQGARACKSAAEVTKASEVIILMVPDTPDVEAVLFGEGGVAAALTPGKLVIDMSSISPVATRDFAARIREKGCDYLDAPVSGGEIGAKSGSLTIMVGGDTGPFERARPLFEIMGKNITLVGDNGVGQMTKVANQMIVGLTIEAVSEAFLLAERAGADLSRVRSALMGGFASSRILEVHGQRIIDAAFDPGFRIRLHRKDLGLALDAARSLEVSLPNTSATLQLMNAALAKGDGDLDHSGLYRALAHMSSHDAADSKPPVAKRA
ncbi:MAG TPA: 2-hydroxy-3-oxopropionate reductase [Devosiaceae bacterium]|jgi:2-hydroxy-3-oxopropionate reductase